MPIDSVSEERTASISQRGGQRLDAVPASAFGIPIVQLCLNDSADGVLRALVDEDEELVGRVNLVGKKIGITEVVAVAGEENVGACSDSGGMDVPVVGVRAVELDGPVKVGDDLVEVRDEVIVQTTRYVSVEFRVQAPASTNCLGDDVNR